MILKIFYHPTKQGSKPNSKKVMGFSDGAAVGNFPFVEFDAGDTHFHASDSFEIIDEGGELVVNVLNNLPNGEQ